MICVFFAAARSLAQDDPANRTFKTLQAAYLAAPAGTPEKPTVIGIKPDLLVRIGSFRQQ
jgi:hypothetical protein